MRSICVKELKDARNVDVMAMTFNTFGLTVHIDKSTRRLFAWVELSVHFLH
jgi:hypothetical protein